MKAFRISLGLFLICAGWVRVAADPLDLDDSDAGVVRYVLGAWTDAQGGLERLDAIRGYEVAQEIESNQAATKTEIHFIETTEGHFRSESFGSAAGTLVQAYDGRTGWRSHSRWGLGPMSKNDVATWIAQNQLLSASELGRNYPRRTFLSDDTVEGRPCYVLGMTGQGHIQEKWFFDKETSQLIKIECPWSGSSSPLEIEFSDFRKTGGLIFPFATKITLGKLSMTARRSKLMINPSIDESAFVLTMEQMREIDAVTAILERQAFVSGTAGDAPARIHSRVIDSIVEASASGIKSHMTISQKAPDLILCQIDTPGVGRTLEGYDGRVGWMESEILGFHRLKSAEILKLENQASNFLIGNLGQSYPLRKLLEPRIINGRPTDAIELATFTGPNGTFYFDRKTGRLLRIIPSRANDPLGTMVDFSNFRVTDGFEMPFVITATNPAGQVLTTLQSVVDNVPLTDDLFSPVLPGH